MKLNNKKCENTKPSNRIQKLADGQGLYLQIMPNGSKYWRYSYRYNNRQKTLALGVYPETSLKEARDLHREARQLLNEHKDPSIERKKDKVIAQTNADNTFELVAREWYENQKHTWKERYAKEVLKRLEEDIFPHIGTIPIKEIEQPLLLVIIRRIENRGAYDLAKRQLQKCGEIFRYAIATGRADRDISYGMYEALKPTKKKHFPCIDLKELPEFLEILHRNDARLYQTTRNAMHLIMLTFVRTNELINAEWKEIDFEKKLWSIPAERMKTGKAHLVPLSDQAIEILKDQKRIAGQWPLVFPSPVKPRQSISNNTILGGLKRMGYKGRMTGHGFRSLAMTGIKERLGYRHEVPDRQLAHVPKNKVDRAYDRAEFLDERTKMMQEWADYLDSLR